VEEKDEVEEENKDEDDYKEPQMNGQGEIGSTSADNADTIVDDEPTVLPEQGEVMGDHTPWPQHPAPAPRPQTPELSPRPRTPGTYIFSGLEVLWLVKP
jgi:hypothetical protein